MFSMKTNYCPCFVCGVFAPRVDFRVLRSFKNVMGISAKLQRPTVAKARASSKKEWDSVVCWPRNADEFLETL